jgi:glutamate-1-semialdehyde 2,1-aminomutase
MQRPEFLRALRRITGEHGALLIFDEVISGFRVGPGGAAEIYGITPDLATFGKVIGGGLPVGAFGGAADIMANLAPEGPVYQAGTLSGNPVAMAAGLETLRILVRDDGWRKLEEAGTELEDMLSPMLVEAPLEASLVRCGSIFWLSLQSGEAPRRADVLDAGAAKIYGPLFHHLLEHGVYLAPSAYEVGFVSLAHRSEHLERLAEALRDALSHASTQVGAGQ